MSLFSLVEKVVAVLLEDRGHLPSPFSHIGILDVQSIKNLVAVFHSFNCSSGITKGVSESKEMEKDV